MPSRDVTIIDYGIGNLRSMEKALESVGARVVRTDSPDVLDRSERAVLPGVGAFGACAAEIRRRGLVEPIRAFAASGRPLLGVCIGMQLLFERSNEQGEHEGLGLLPGSVTRFDFASNRTSTGRLKIPHMGWNAVSWTREDPILEGLDAIPYFYFVHSYHARPGVALDTLGTSMYGHPFAAVVGRGNVYGLQFHPEKSQRNGLRILANFAELGEGEGLRADGIGLSAKGPGLRAKGEAPGVEREVQWAEGQTSGPRHVQSAWSPPDSRK